eukprot:gene3747-695_t
MCNQALSILIEEEYESLRPTKTLEFCLMPSYSGLSPSIRFPGLTNLEGLSYSWRVKDVCWPPYTNPDSSICKDGSPTDCQECASPPAGSVAFPGESDVSCKCMGGARSSSRLHFEIQFSRPHPNVMIKVFLPPLIITLVNQAAFLMSPAKVESRLSVCGSSLVSSVLFHVSLGSQTPSSSTLTFFDSFMAVVYMINLCSWLVTVIILLILASSNTKGGSPESFRLPCCSGNGRNPAQFSLSILPMLLLVCRGGSQTFYSGSLWPRPVARVHARRCTLTLSISLVAACGSLWLPVAHCGPLRLPLWPPVAHCGPRLWRPVAHCGPLGLTVTWLTVAPCGSLWPPVAPCGRLSGG